MKIKAKAFLFDLNGTIIDDMPYHADAWFDILNKDLNAKLSKEEVKLQMYGKNAELLIRIFGKDYFTSDQINELSLEKERRYQKSYLPKLALIEGLQQFLEASKNAGILMAIGSAAIPFNINFVLDNLKLRSFFPVVVVRSHRRGKNVLFRLPGCLLFGRRLSQEHLPRPYCSRPGPR